LPRQVSAKGAKSLAADGPGFSVVGDDGIELVQPDTIARDWAIVTLMDTLDLSPITWHIIRNADLPGPAEAGEIARSGYSQDSSYLLSPLLRYQLESLRER
jgi:hypothetical protein